MSSSDPKMFKATKITPEEAKKLDKNKMYTGRPTPGTKEVEGQRGVIIFGTCPWCGAGNWVLGDTDFYQWFTCWNCGKPFRA